MKKSKYCCDLQSCFMCKLSLKEWLPAISSYRKNFLVKKGVQIIKEGEPVTGVYFVYTGKVKVHKQWGDKELIIRFAANGAILGHRGLGNKSSVYPISATALENSMVCFIDIDFFISTLKVNHDLTFNLMMFYADELQESERRMRNLALIPVKARLAQALLQLKSQFDLTGEGYLNIELSRQDLAAFAGATYETVFRMINELIQEKLITVSGKRIKLNDEKKLIRMTAY